MQNEKEFINCILQIVLGKAGLGLDYYRIFLSKTSVQKHLYVNKLYLHMCIASKINSIVI